MWRKPQRARKVKKTRDGGTVDLKSQTQQKRRSNKGGRHVGLDFYDLLIEAIGAAAEVTKVSELSINKGTC
jgi:hypothetical protein